MDVREKLALSVCNATQKTNFKCEFNCEKKGKCAYCLVMADQMIANGVTVQEWISVNDRLPKGGAIVLCNTDYFVEVLQWDERADMWVDQYGSYRKNYVTHWMPLPQPPKGE